MTIAQLAAHYDALAAELYARRLDGVDYSVIEARLMRRFRIGRRDIWALRAFWEAEREAGRMS